MATSICSSAGACQDGSEGDVDYFIIINDACGCEGTPTIDNLVVPFRTQIYSDVIMRIEGRGRVAERAAYGKWRGREIDWE